MDTTQRAEFVENDVEWPDQQSTKNVKHYSDLQRIFYSSGFTAEGILLSAPAVLNRWNIS